MGEIKIGHITHYYSHLGVGIIKIENDTLKVGDTIHIKGHTTDLIHTVDSIQIEHNNVDSVKADEMAGIKFSEHVREHDEVFKVEG